MSNFCEMDTGGAIQEHALQKVENKTSEIGFLGLPEAPVYYPTEEEFGDPLAFIEKIRQEAEVYGICRIVPPKKWNPPFAIDKSSFAFPTKLQAIHHLQKRPAARDGETFRLEYSRFLEKEGFKVENWPTFQGKELDLCTLFGAVKRHGGCQKVTRENKWAEVLQILDPLALRSEYLRSSLKNLYETHLYEFEKYQSRSVSMPISRKRNRTVNEPEAKPNSKGRKPRKWCVEESDHVSKVKDDTQEEGDSKIDQICEQCQSGVHEQSILLCDRCNRGWHLYCLTPPLLSVPSGNWYCFDCLTCEKESFGFITGEVHSFDSFRRVAERFRKRWFGTKEATVSEIEEEFWSVVERQKGPVEVLYGSDLASEEYGSGFPRPSDPIPEWADPNSWNEYATSPWNLNNFTKLDGSVLKHVRDNIPGVTVPWVYMGMLFSSFCWHYEDQCFYSINYLHWGEPKCWYGVPGSAIGAFEQVMHKMFPDLFEAQPDLLFQLVTMLNPKVLHDNNVPVCTTIQEKGNFVITFPRSYHGGFNHGLNCAEAVNFATLDWLPFGRFGVERTRLYHKAAVLCHEELLCVVAKNAQNCVRSSHWLKEELKGMITLERRQRMQLWKNGIVRSSRMLPRKCPDVIGAEEDLECVICQYYLFISGLTCSCCPGRFVCLQHCEQLCECNKDKQQLLYRYSLAELDDLELQLQNLDMANAYTCGIVGAKKKRGRPPNPVTKKVNGCAVYHTKLAEDWCEKAEKILKMTPKLSEIEILLTEAEQFLWAGHDMDYVSVLEKRLLSAQNWARSIVACVAPVDVKLEAQNSSQKCYLATAQKLLSMNPPPCDMEGLILKLKEIVDATLFLRKQVRVLFSKSPPWQLPELEEVHLMVSKSPLNFPEAEKLERLVSSCNVWRERVQNLLLESRKSWISGEKNNMDMDKLHILQMEAGKLCVILPEMKILEAYVRKLERWQDRAKIVVECTMSLQAVEEFLSEIENVPVYFRESEILEKRVYEAKEWIRSAHKVLADVKQQKYYHASIGLMSALLRSGESLKIEVKELDYIKTEVKRVSWLEKASKGLKSQLPRLQLMELIKEAQHLSLDNEVEYIELFHIAQAASMWEAKASIFLRDGASLEDFKALRRDSGKIYASLSGWVDINLGIIQVESFLHHAEAFLNPHKKAALKFTLLEELINQSLSFKIDFPERALLDAIFIDVSSWKKRAIDIINHAKETLHSCQLMEHFSMDEAAGMKSRIIGENDNLLLDLKKIDNEGKQLGFDLPELEMLSTLVVATKWNLKMLHLLLERPSIQELEFLIEEAMDFADCIGHFPQLQCLINDGKKWVDKLNMILHHDSQVKCCVHELEELLTEGRALHINICNDVDHLEQLLDCHKTSQNQILKCLHSRVHSISWEDLHQLQKVTNSSRIKFDEAEALAFEMKKVQTWLSKCTVKLVGQPDFLTTPLTEILVKVQTSVDNALHQLKKKTYIEGHYSYTEGEDLCHLCKKHVDCTHSSLMACDNCSDRYHRSCLGLDHCEDWPQEHFVCSFCNAFTAGILWLDEDVLSKICITKRPTMNALKELLQSAEGIQFRMREAELLEAIISSVQEWENCLQKLLEPILRSHTNQKYSSSSLLSALKIAGTMEIQQDENCQLALALSVNAWRMQTTSIMESATKPSYRTVCRALKEGLAIPFLSHDCVLKDLKTWETMASVWLSETKMAIEDDGTTPLEDVQKLILEGEQLPIAFSKEIEDLRSRTVLYCICRKPYDKERAMIACDSCSEWYHSDCVTLPEPDSCDDESPDMVQKFGSAGEFLCPNCKPDESTNFVLKKSSRKERGSVSSQPLWYGRGKRSSRMAVRVRKGDLQERWKSQKVMPCSKSIEKGSDSNSNQTVVSPSGRPCRRTAGQNSRFESFVLLMHSG